MNITDSQQGTVCMDGVEPTFEQLKRGADALARTDHVEQSGRFQGLVEPVTWLEQLVGLVVCLSGTGHSYGQNTLDVPQLTRFLRTVLRELQ